MGKRKKLGDIVEIPLGSGLNAYARLYREGALGIYKGKYHGFEEVPADTGYYRFITLYASSLSKLKVVGNIPFLDEADSWQPDMVAVDALTGKGRLYHHGQICDCSYEECKALEVCAVWELEHLVDMLNGSTKWDESIRKPVK